MAFVTPALQAVNQGIMSQNGFMFEVSLNLTYPTLCSFSIRINNRTLHCDLCLKDDYDYGDPDNDPIFLVQSWPECWEVNLSSKEVVFVGFGWYFYSSDLDIWKGLRIRDRRRLVRKCRKVLQRAPGWRWVVGVDYGI